MSSIDYGYWAEAARDFTKRMLSWGPANQVQSSDALYIPLLQRMGANMIGRTFMMHRDNVMSPVAERLEIARVAMSLTTGNCSEHASVAFCFCVANDVYPVEVWGYDHGSANHQIAVLGRAPGRVTTTRPDGHTTSAEAASYVTNPWGSHPGDSSWISDAWANAAYPSSDLKSREPSLSAGKIVSFQLQAAYTVADPAMQAKAEQLIRANGFSPRPMN
ncbi:hypothetical protein [Roseomonas fluvialis]|uniref:Uncharacterized protein n=1 Tax=Roseomonas fluvialis TaxID=1750527 RepID=A0ABN6P6R3_9PROT|nr:hypothetical protein [Roseomonas fluvialis]BDG73673.1 hypothetical protein Rmf_36020 [Roseomonas fluvialis]